MQLNINTNQSKDKNVKGVYAIQWILSNLISERMVIPTLQFFVDKAGCKLVRK